MRENLKYTLGELIYIYYLDIMYVTLLIFSASVLSLYNPQNRFIYFTILGIHFISLYLFYYMEISIAMVLSNILLIISAILLHVFIPIVLTIVVSFIISFSLSRVVDELIVEEGTIWIGDSPSEEEKRFYTLKKESVRRSIKTVFLSILLALFVESLFFNGFSILANVILSVAYIALILLLTYLGEEKCLCLDDICMEFPHF